MGCDRRGNGARGWGGLTHGSSDGAENSDEHYTATTATVTCGTGARRAYDGASMVGEEARIVERRLWQRMILVRRHGGHARGDRAAAVATSATAAAAATVTAHRLLPLPSGVGSQSAALRRAPRKSRRWSV